MDPVDPDVDVVPVGQVAGHKGTVLVLPGRDEPGDHRSRQPGCRAEEALEGGDEVACRKPVQVQERKHLGDLRGPAAPGRKDDRAKLGLLAGRLVHATIVHPRCFDLECSGHGLNLAWPGMAVPRHEPVTLLVTLAYELGEIRVNLGLQGGGEHRPCPFAADLIQARASFRANLVVVHYAQHRRPFLAGALSRLLVLDLNEEGTSPPGEWVIHNFRSYLDGRRRVLLRRRCESVGDASREVRREPRGVRVLDDPARPALARVHHDHGLAIRPPRDRHHQRGGDKALGQPVSSLTPRSVGLMSAPQV